jgi:hypothetical protein
MRAIGNFRALFLPFPVYDSHQCLLGRRITGAAVCGQIKHAWTTSPLSAAFQLLCCTPTGVVTWPREEDLLKFPKS